MADDSKQEVKVNVIEKKVEDMSFFKKFVISIKDFERYPDLAGQKTSKVIGYLAILIALVTMITGICFSASIIQKIQVAVHYVDTEFSEIQYVDGTLNIIGKQLPWIQEMPDEMVEKLIVDTRKQVSEEELKEYEKQMKNTTTGITLLQDKLIFKMAGKENLVTYSYSEIAKMYDIDEITKQSIIDYFSGNNLWMIGIAIFITYFLYSFMSNFIVVLMYAAFLGFAGYITAILLHLRLRIGAMCKMAVHSLTLPTLLLALYTIINLFTGFKMSYFDIMYVGVAYIYIIAALFIIKTEVMKKQQELAKIIEEQALLAAEKKAEKEREEQEKKELEEKERRRKRDEEKKKKQEEENKPNSNGEEPQTGNA